MVTTRSTRATALLAPFAVSWAAACSSVSYSHDFDRQTSILSSGTWAWQAPSPEEGEALAKINPFLERRIERAVENELAGAGFTRIRNEIAAPDYVVTAYPVLPERRDEDLLAGTWRSQPRVSVGLGVAVAYPYYAGWPYRGVWGVPWYGWHGTYPYAAPWWFGASATWGGWPYVGWPSYAWSPWFGYGAYSTRAYGWPGTIGAGDRDPGSLVIDVIDPATGTVLWQGVAEGALLDMPAADRQDDYVDEVVHRTLKDFPPGRDN